MRREILGGVLRYCLLLLLLTALLLLSGSMWVLAALLLLLLLPPASLGLNAWLRRGLRAELSLPTTAAKGSAVSGRLSVHNASPLPIGRYFCTLEVINDLTGERERLVLPGGVGAGQTASHSFLLQSRHCGRLYASIQSITLLDCLGLLPLRAVLRASARSTVLPELFPLELALAARPASAEEGTANRRGEDRSEVFQLREYRAGDDIRQLHWKLSAKLDMLVLREASMPESRSMLLFWDKRTVGTPAQMDALAEVVASVSSALVEEGIAFTLSWTEREELQTQEISDENSLLQAIPALVKNVGNADCRLPEMSGFSRVLWFGIRTEPQLDTDARVHFILCGQCEQPNVTAFAVQNYQETLRRLEV